MYCGDTRQCTHDDDSRLTSKKRSSNQLTRLSVRDLSEVYRSKGRPLSTLRPGEDAEALK
eukprot:4020456-Prymnesium_polylepis.1